METFDVSALAANRLDLVSTLLGAIALLLALGVFPLFGFLQYRAQKVARETAQEELKVFMENLESTAISRIEAMLPGLIRDYMPFVQENSVDDQVANAIAVAQEVKTDVADTRDPESPRAGTGGRARSRSRTGRKGP